MLLFVQIFFCTQEFLLGEMGGLSTIEITQVRDEFQVSVASDFEMVDG